MLLNSKLIHLLVFLWVLFIELCNGESEIKLVHQENEITPDGFNIRYGTSDGTEYIQTGVLNEEKSFDVTGSYKFQAPDGGLYETIYIADKNGVRAKVSKVTKIPDAEIPDDEIPILRADGYSRGISSAAIASLAG